MNLNDLNWTTYGSMNNDWKQARFCGCIAYHHQPSNTYRIFASYNQAGDPRVWDSLEPIEAQCIVNYLVDVHP